MKYRKKPVVIEAELLTEDNLYEVYDWVGAGGGQASARNLPDGKSLAISTLEGEMIARPGDYIIKGVKGEFYPCKPDIFEATYDRVYESTGGLA